MAIAMVDGLHVAYDVIGHLFVRSGALLRHHALGGRFSKDYEGVRELAQAIADRGHHVVVWDRPNCGESDVCFAGSSESAMQADVLAGLLRELGMAPAVIIGGSGGSRVSSLTAARHPDVAAWAGDVVDQRRHVRAHEFLGLHYCSGSLLAAWDGDMQPAGGATGVGRGAGAKSPQPRELS